MCFFLKQSRIVQCRFNISLQVPIAGKLGYSTPILKEKYLLYYLTFAFIFRRYVKCFRRKHPSNYLVWSVSNGFVLVSDTV